jgi:hypothetical protein
MVSVPLAFFQVAATAIPTLLVAMAVGMKRGEGLGTAFKNAKKQYQMLIVLFTLLMVAVIGWGEMLALLVLAKGQGEVWQARWVFTAIATLIFVLIVEFVGPLDRALGKWGNYVFGPVVILIWFASILVFGISLG